MTVTAAPKPTRRPRRRGHRDPVTTDLYHYIVARDGYECVAPSLGAPDRCANRWGRTWPPGGFTSNDLTLDHVRDQPMTGKRAPSDARHLVTLCWHHHLDGWATANRLVLRDYLARVEAD